MTSEAVRNTIDYLRLCQKARALGYPTTGPVVAEYSLMRDPEWLVDMAINRRAGWPDDPTLTRGSAMPVNQGIRTEVGAHRIGIHPGMCPAGVYPKRAAGDWGWRTLVQFAHRVNSRSRIRSRELGILGRVGRTKLAYRVSDDDY